jgi:dihydrofolate reductase
MRKVTFGGAVSLDGYFARKNHSVDWLMRSPEAAPIMARYWKSIDTLVMGRKTYQAGLKLTKGKGNPYVGFKPYVFSRTLKSGIREGVEIVATDPIAFVRKLRRKAGKGIAVMGGGELAHPLLEAGLIDEIGFNIQPVVLGSGIPVFHEMKRQFDLDLLECRRFKNGCVYVSYRVRPWERRRHTK